MTTKRRKYLIAASPTIIIIAISYLTPMVAVGHFEDPFSFDWARPVPDAHGVCCVEPSYSVIARFVAFLSPIFVVVSLVWMLAIWIRSRRD